MKKFLSEGITLGSCIGNSTEIEFSPESMRFTINPSIANRIKAIAEKDKNSVNSILLTAFTILLCKYTREEESVIENIVQTENTGNPYRYAFIKYAINEKDTFRSANMGISILLTELSGGFNKEDSYHSVIFDTVTMLNEMPLSKELKFSLWIRLNEASQGNGIDGRIDFNAILFDKNEIERFGEHFLNVLEEVAENPEMKLCDMDMLSEKEKNKILIGFNDTKAEYPKEKTLYELFEEQVERTPNNIAIEYGEKKLTYKELDTKANSLALLLQGKGVAADSIVGIMADRSEDMIIGIMAILKAGGAYLPIDPEYPGYRVEYMLSDSNTKILLTQSHLLGNLEFDGETIIADEVKYDTEENEVIKYSHTGNLAYIIYTSGSTGKPKGVMIEHRTAVNLAYSQISKFKIDENEKVLQFSSLCFDASVEQIFIALLSGATLVLASKATILDIQRFEQYLIEHEVTHIHAVPSFLSNISYRKEYKLKRVVAGGDICPVNLAKYWSVHCEFYNEYGPTETTVTNTMLLADHIEEGTNNLSIGKPIYNVKIYILDKYQNLLPVGIPGELYIAGNCLARGYLNNIEITSEKFMEDPFTLGQKMYKTGDLARWLPDGNIEFLGRIDHQVKIRGFRIELGEIESQLLEYEGISEVIVIVREDKNKSSYLCGYVCGERAYSISELREHLSKKLPDYMIPVYFLQLDKLPLNTNGKIDRKALPEPDGSINTEAEYAAAANEMEEKLISIWREVLDIGGIGINDNFFELGGHSLKAIKLVSMIQKELMAEIYVGDIFSNPTVRQLGEYIGKIKESAYSPIEAVEERELYEVSSAQKRMFALNQLSKEETNYNLPSVMILEGRLEKSKVEESFKKLVQRHEAFRTSFELADDKIMQRIHNVVEFKMEYEEISTDSEESIKSEAEKFIKPFDLSKAPLLRVKLLRLEEEKHVLMSDMHHIISDGTSMSFITEEFTKLYKGESLVELRVQYKDYSAWENKRLTSEAMKKHEEYWTKMFSEDIPVLNLPMDYPRLGAQSFEGESIGFGLDKRLTEKLKKISKANGATLYMTLLSAYNILLSKYSGQEDIIVGSAAAGRPHADLQNMVGMFVNTLAMRNYPEVEKTFDEFLQDVKKNALGAYEHQDYQFDVLVEKLGIRRDLSRNALFDTMFVLQNTDTKQIELQNIKIREYAFRGKVSRFDITLEAEEKEEEIAFNLEYCTKLFKRQTIERMIEHYKNILEAVAEKPEMELWEIDMLSAEEKNKVLIGFNDTKAEYPKDKTICALFEEHAERTPDNIAVVYEDGKLTYRELNERANQLARLLNGKGIGENDIVGLVVERSLEMVVGIMGILKAGGAYLPINPEYPGDRINYMIDDSKAKVVLTQSKFRDRIEAAAEAIDLEDATIYTSGSSNIGNNVKSDNAAYVIYTSGSTGKPKGVVVEHRALHNFLNTIYQRFKGEVGEKDRCLSLTNISFDVAVGEIFLPLTYGATLVLFENDIVLDIRKLAYTIVKEKITFAYIPPTILKEVCGLLSEHKGDLALNKMLVGVEPIKDYILEGYMSLNENMQVINGYGPTEATICATMYNYGDKEPCGRKVPIGSPMLNTQIYILDSSGKPVPVGIAGELCISGDNLARGYLYRPELTEEKFVENPFIPGERMYKTGDLARWLADGNIEFLGRIDYQVKIRGYRIEPGEIESELLKDEGIKEAVVLDKQDGQGNKYLCAYIVSEKEIIIRSLREKLSQSLPDYMIPTYFVQIEKIPLTLNGKINRKALPEPEVEINTGVEYTAPRNDVEERLIEIWNEVLEVGRIGINDDFFTLGGHSLKAIKMAAIIQRELMAEISVGEIFSRPTVGELGEFIGKTKESAYSAIEAVEEREVYEVSSAQKRMFALNQFSKEETNYNIPYVLIFEGKLERNKVEECFKKLVQRHEAFRTSFELAEVGIMQRIHKDVELTVEYEEINTDSEEVIKSETEKFVKPFDLSKAPLLRVKLIRLIEGKYALMLDMHHIISDGTSVSIIMEEFTKLYKGESLEELSVQYKDYSVWENKMLASEAMKKHEEYWTTMFGDEIPVLNLPTDYPRPSIQSYEGESIGFRLGKHLTEKLKKVGMANGATLYMILLSAYNILLSRYSGQEDIIIGAAAAGRPHVDLHNMVGMFVNTLAMRNYPEGKKKFDEFLQEVKKNALGAYEHQDYQFDKLVEKLDIRRDLSRSALLDTVFVLQNTDTKELELPNIRIREYAFKGKVSKFDITLEAEEKGEEIKFNLEYCTKLFKRETIERLIKHFINIFEEIAENPEIKLCEIDMLSEEEKRRILVDFNDTKTQYPKNKTICELFEAQVERTPDNTAAVYEDKKLTYRELNEKANSLAGSLREKGVRADSIVGIMAERSLEMIIGIVGILKAGGAYLPIDSDYPKDRIKYMLEDSKAEVLLIEQRFAGEIPYEGSIVNLNDGKAYNENKENLEKISGAENLAYVIYTSGTTGKPKGVAVTQKNVVRLVQNTNYIAFKEEDRILQTGSVTFDASTFEIWGALLTGIKLYLTSKDVILNGERLGEYLSTNKISVIWLTSPLFNKLCEEDPTIFKGLRCLLTGGDVVSPRNVNLVRKYAPGLTVVNGYGPTENTTFSSCYVIKEALDENKTIPIGRPIANSTAYILDKYNKAVPVGVYGELCVGGDGLARGYLNNEELTAVKFVENPYEAGQIMYRTGDLVRWLPDGNIEFLGRIDHQVKIRGFRIELAEIESSLLKLDGVKEAIVIVREEEGNKYLCAYLVSEAEYSAGRLRDELKKSLPDYMIPSYFIMLPEMPLNQSGKIDRKALPIPDGSIETGVEYIAPRNEAEEKLVKIWSEVLGVSRIGINDDFFTLGGHSLKAIKMVAIIQRELMVEISVGEIFKNPTVRELGKYIGKTKESAYSSIEAVEEREVYEVSSAQKRLFALNQFSKEETNYNIPYVLIFEGKLERNKVEEAFKKLVQRHEAFRTSFELADGEIMQRIHKAVEFKVEYEKINTDSEEIIKAEVKKFVRPFDLSKAPLLRVKLIRLKEEKYVLMFDIHHIISDGTSMSILMEEFTKLYKGENLEALSRQYKDYSVWENKMLASEVMKKQEEYWTKMFSDEIPVLNLPADYPRPGFQSFEGESIGFTLDKDLTERLKKISKANGATLYMTLLSAYNILLSKHSGQEDIVVGSPIAGRPHADLHNMVGMFVNTFAMRNYPVRKKTFNGFLQEVKKNALSAYENQTYPFDKLVEKLDIRRDLSRNALFDTMFILQNTENKEIQLDHVRMKQYQFERGVSKFDITLSAEEKGEEIKFDLEYCTKLFKRETIERLIEHFKNILEEVAGDPEIELCEIDMLSEEEKKEILVDFNNTKTAYPKEKTICEAFEEQVKKTPDNVAVVYEDKKLTYKELNEKANQLAGVLRGKGVKADTIVGIMVERSLEMMIGIMGIIKAGGAYLPISPEYPDDRIKYMLEDSKTAILLTQKRLVDTIKFDGIAIDLEDRQLYQESKTNLEIVNNPNNLAYVIYTSGSTGKPKGVMIRHGSVMNLVTALGKIIYDKYVAPLNVTLIAPYVFDASVKQIFASLLRGNCLHIIPEEHRNIGEKLIEYYIDHSIDISDGTPSHFKLILGDNREKIKDIPVKHFIIGGEELTVHVVKDFLAFFKDKKPDITNIYGPTECCVDSTAFLVDSDQLDRLNTIPIGRPLVNYSVYVLDKDNKLQPVGVAGELCIAGEGVARGYLNKPELTEEKFAANPFVPGEKMYKTGDLVRWLPDGNIEFLGRIDHQVKIRGYRIEIGEIEAFIKSHPSVQDSVVIVREDNTGEKRLVAYIVSKANSDAQYGEAGLREYLKKKLPQYMIPAIFVRLESIPLNTNGKVDRFALPEPDMLQRNPDEGFIAPRNKEEIEMAAIWTKILGTPKIGIDDDFFDLGGDSFKAIRLVRSISSSLGVMELFKHATIRELVAYLSKDVSSKRTMLHELTKPVDEKDKAVSLICFPYGGGSAISFQPLANALPKNYSLYSVELPGHDYSCSDEELASIEESASRCLEEIKQKVKGPIVLYGHCLGATMAALLAIKLEEAGIQVDGVFVGAMFPTPRISNRFFNIWDKIFPSQLTDKGNRDMLITIGGLNSEISSDETEFILRNLKHDSKECIKWYTQFYNNKEKTKFKAPITCVIGEGDRATEFYQERYKEWEHFSERVDLKTIKHAGHFFFKNQAAELTEIIKEKVNLWQGRSSVFETKKKDESKESTVKLEAPAKKQVVPSMNLFLIVAIVQIISEIGTILSTFGTGIWVFKQTNALSQFAMMFLLGVLPTILVLPVSGAIVDRFDRRLILIVSDILSAICSLGLLILLYNNGLQIWQVYVFTIAASVANCFRLPAYMAAVTQITPKMYLPQANSVSQFSVAIGGILASICGGVFMDSIGFKGLVAIDFATFIISLVVLIFIRFPDTMFTRLEEPIMKELMGGWNFIIKRKSLVAMVIFFLIVNFLLSIFEVTMTPLILSFTNPSVLGVINAFNGIGVLCGAIAMLITGGTKKRAKGMVGFVIPLAISITVAAIRPLPVFAAMALFGVYFSVTVVNIHWQSLIQVKVGLELQGRVFAVNRMLVAVLAPISYITAGILADKVFAPMMGYSVFNSSIVNIILGAGAGRAMRLTLLIAGALLFAWSLLGVRYKELSEMDDILEDAIPGQIIIKDKDKLQAIVDRRIDGKTKAGLYS